MVDSVHAHEEAKIRILNATHSGVAWAGTLRGLSYIHEDMAVPAIRQMAWAYVTDDVIPSLDSPEHPAPFDLAAYRDVVLERFGNPFVRDTNQRVAMDGFSKIPGFLAPTLRAPRPRALRRPVRPRHQPARRDGRFLEDSRLCRADPARADRPRPAGREHGDAAPALLRLSRALASRRARLRLSGRRHGRRGRACLLRCGRSAAR